MICGLKSCFNAPVVGWVHDTERDPMNVLAVLLCGPCIRAAALVPEYKTHMFRVNKVPVGYA